MPTVPSGFFRSTTARNSSICSIETGNPISCCASATASQIRRHVLNLCLGDQSLSMSRLAFRSARGEVYVSYWVMPERMGRPPVWSSWSTPPRLGAA